MKILQMTGYKYHDLKAYFVLCVSMKKQAFMNFFEKTKDVVLNYKVRDIKDNCEFYGVIVEPRCHPCLEYVIKNFLRFTNDKWGLHVFHGVKNESFIKDLFKNIENIIYTNINKDNLSIEEYNILVTSNSNFHDKIRSNTFLIFQSDSLFLRDMNDKLMKYDYVGAPWPHHDNMVGNGGLSIRNKNIFITICNQFIRPNNLPEDLFYAICLKRIDANVAPFIVACDFSCENIPTTSLPIGCHEHIQNIQIPNIVALYIQNFNINEVI